MRSVGRREGEGELGVEVEGGRRKLALELLDLRSMKKTEKQSGWQIWFSGECSPDEVVYDTEEEAMDAAWQYGDAGKAARIVPSNWDEN